MARELPLAQCSSTIQESILKARSHQGYRNCAKMHTRRSEGTFGDELLAAEGHAAVATVARLDANSCFIDKHFSLPSVADAG